MIWPSANQTLWRRGVQRTAAVTVKYTTANGTAQVGSDYLATGSVLTFPAGQWVQTVRVAVRGERINSTLSD
jgi:hypothetical protein